MGEQRQVVYTALFGEHELLNEQPAQKESSVRFICFTDDEELSSKTWEIHHVLPLFPADPRLSQRNIKLRGHSLLAGFHEWLYIDNTVRLKKTPESIFKEWLSGYDWAAILQPRDSVWEEFEKNLELQKDVPERLNEQLNDYSRFHASALEEVPLWNAMFARKNNETVREVTELWFSHVCRYSSRDQLSQTVAMSSHSIRVNGIQASARLSEWHEWPHRNGETPLSKAFRKARPENLKHVSVLLAEANERLTTAQSRIQELEKRQWLGLRGLWRSFQAARRRHRRLRRKRQRLKPR